MAILITVIGSRWFFYLTLAAWFAYFASHLWPASTWLEVQSVHVLNGKVGEPVLMAVDRKINRAFHANWEVTVHKWEGGFSFHCRATGASNYRPGAELPKNLTLRWWTYDQCTDLPPGRYRITTRWVIDNLGVIADRAVSVDSNVFEISP